MLSGKALILATKPYASENRLKSWFYALSTAFLLLAALFGTLYNFNIWLKIACSLFAGLVIVRMFVIYHDHQHHSILQKSKLADLFFTVFGLYILAPTSIWKRSHDYHHKHNSKMSTASIGSYPIYSREKFVKSSRSEQRSYLFIRHPLTISFGYIFAFLYGMCIKSFMSCYKRHLDSLLAIILHFAFQGLVFYYFGWQSWLLCTVIPHFIACALGAYLFYAQHNFPGVTFVTNGDWTYEGAALDSSSYMKMSWFMRWVTANIGYHHIHHLNSRIPFYRLPEAMAAIPELQAAKRTSLRPKDIAQCVRLKVWDPELNQMSAL